MILTDTRWPDWWLNLVAHQSRTDNAQMETIFRSEKDDTEPCRSVIIEAADFETAEKVARDNMNVDEYDVQLVEAEDTSD
jgi:hypothetical protein